MDCKERVEVYKFVGKDEFSFYRGNGWDWRKERLWLAPGKFETGSPACRIAALRPSCLPLCSPAGHYSEQTRPPHLASPVSSRGSSAVFPGRVSSPGRSPLVCLVAFQSTFFSPSWYPFELQMIVCSDRPLDWIPNMCLFWEMSEWFATESPWIRSGE